MFLSKPILVVALSATLGILGITNETVEPFKDDDTIVSVSELMEVAPAETALKTTDLSATRGGTDIRRLQAIVQLRQISTLAMMRILIGLAVGRARTFTGDFQTIIRWRVERDSTPELLVSGSVLFPIEFYWVSRGQLRTADAPPTSEGIRSVKRTEGADELLIRMNETVSPYHTLVRECERINNTETVELEGYTYLEYGAQFRVDWKRANSGLELVVPVTEKSKYVTVTIQYPNANGWDRVAEGNPVNHANYAFVFTDN
ncbi:hypothetical protein NXS08_05790 [Gleimia sp. 6138-11-ORH1]|uniref:hypothetical protein n=1 Tax=Gleimia sp. 6138-11-ORH1 TaxID=2973937 RepID=UPI00216871AB|nr:hypothetical protein [Gleimia sp. 6138-11-ORH1]MCS4484979.1 hypothetical protein [Gleimia sp. 6138-11-ORH1]